MFKSIVFALTVYANLVCRADTQTPVFYFGGYASSEAQMKCWEKGAQAQTDHDGYSFKGIPYPAGTAADSASAVHGGQAQIDQVVRAINKSPGRRFVIVGHSSGAALANRVAELVNDPSQIELFDLDGFAAPSSVQKKVDTTCVYAVNQATALQSRNAGSMIGCKKSHAYHDDHCQSKWCLHFSLVNKQVPAYLSTSTFGTQGYRGCATNLSWLAPKQIQATPKMENFAPDRVEK